MRLEIEQFEYAAELSSQCRAARIATTGTGLLICAISLGWQMLTTGADFQRYRKLLPSVCSLNDRRRPGPHFERP